jgi:serine/threonine protein kinase
MSDWKKELRELSGLKDDGLISETEFEAERDRIMAGRGAGASRSSSPDLQKIGSYRVLARIGDGGMGSVYRARHQNEHIAERQGGDVALKVMHPQYAQNPELRARFDREASVCLKLNHPGIVRVHDLLEDQGQLGMVMELVEGRPLSVIIGTEVGPIPWDRAEPLFFQLLEAVGYAHQNGVVHRDIKPDNVMVTSDQRVKVLDFGIAKDLEAGRTKTGTGMGTVAYMAPEQYTDAKSVDHRADIYALGMTLYEMVAGRLPWEDSETEFGIMKRKEVDELPQPTDFYPYIPDRVVALIQRNLQAEVDARLDSCAACQEFLSRPEQEASEDEESSEDEELSATVEAAVPPPPVPPEEETPSTESAEVESSPPPPEVPSPTPPNSTGDERVARSKLPGMVLAGLVLLTIVGIGVHFWNQEPERKQSSRKSERSTGAADSQRSSTRSASATEKAEEEVEEIEILCLGLDDLYDLTTVVLGSKDGKNHGVNGFYQMRLSPETAVVRAREECRWSMDIEKIGYGSPDNLKRNHGYVAATVLSHHDSDWWTAEVTFDDKQWKGEQSSLSLQLYVHLPEKNPPSELEGIWTYTERSWQINQFHGTFKANGRTGATEGWSFLSHASVQELDTRVQSRFGACQSGYSALHCF